MLGVGLFCVLLVACVSVYAHPNGIRKVKRDVDPSFNISDEYGLENDEELPSHVRYSPEEVNIRMCKRFHQGPKIVNGQDARAKEFPHMAVLGYGNKDNIHWDCGGSLISWKFVLTAMHCLTFNNQRVAHVRLGDLDLKSTTDDAQPQQFTVKAIHKHRQFRSPLRYHDIAILELDRKAQLTNYVRPACVGMTDDITGTKPMVAGWGLTRKGGNPANILQTASMEYVPAEKCNRTYISNRNMPRGVDNNLSICAGGGTNKTDTCQGDSGGPLQIMNDNYKFGTFPEIVGITSIGRSCGFLPGIYTRVSNYMPWIRKIVWPNSQTFDNDIESQI